MMRKLLQIMLLALMPLCMQAQTVTIKASNASTYLTTTAPEVLKPGSYRFTVKDHEDLRNAKKIIIAADLPANTYRDFQYNHGGNDPNVAHSTVLANLEELELQEGHNIRQLQVWGTRLKKLIINNPSSNNYFRELNVAGSFLTENDIILGNNVKFDQLHLHRNKITSLEKFYTRFKDPGTRTAGLYCNGDPYVRRDHAYVDEDETYSPTNVLREIDMSQIPLIVHGFQFKYNLLEHLDAGGHTNIANLILSNNLLWSLDLNSVETAPAGNYIISPQKPVADLTVVKGTAEDGSGDEVRLNLPVDQNALFNGERLKPHSVKLLNKEIATQALQHDGTQNYFKVASVAGAGGTTADLDLYEKDNGFSYEYDHRPNFAGTANESLRYMTVQVKTYPYIMYINPLTKQKGNNINFYSGTLWLDYDAVVPKGTTVWIVTGIKDKSKIVSGGTASAYDQLELKQIGEEGDLIPAGTAMFVRAEDQAGLYDFQKVWKHKLLGWSADTVMYEKDYTDDQLTQLQAMRDKIASLGGNLLEGAGTITDFHGPRRALTLGFESDLGKGVIGFWPYNGTTSAPHRCFIRETTYKNAAGSNSAKGGIFFFNDPETTGITHVNNNVGTDDDAWYSLDGRRLSGKPSWKGVYIHKGRKEVIR